MNHKWKTGDDPRRLTIRLPLAVVRQLRIRAATEDVSLNQFICQALEHTLSFPVEMQQDKQ